MPDPVYIESASDGKSGKVSDAVYRKMAKIQPDTGNHNPRVWGSSPSSATTHCNALKNNNKNIPMRDSNSQRALCDSNSLYGTLAQFAW